MTSLPSSSGTKRVGDSGDGNPNKNEPEIPEPKRQKIVLNNPLKVKCLHLMLQSYEGIIEHIVTSFSGNEANGKDKQSLMMNIDLANKILLMIRSVHNIRCQDILQRDKIVQPGKEKTNIKKIKVCLSGEEMIINIEDIMKIWDSSVLSVELSYLREDTEWFDTLNLLMDCFSGFHLRRQELCRGINKFVMHENSDTHAVSTYGLGIQHHVLLEGITFPPDRRRSMIKSLGPMTAFLCLLLSSDKYRYVYEEAVMEAMGHIPCIDVIIDIVKKENWKHNLSSKCNMYMLIKTIADILLLNTVREPTNIFFPLNFLAVAACECRKNGKINVDQFLDFSFSGSGGFYMYKILNEVQKTHKFTMRCKMTEEIATQLAFHCLFGTFKEDFGVLSCITPHKSWNTRMESSKLNVTEQSDLRDVKIELIPFNIYPKNNCAKQTLLVTANTYNIYSVPCYTMPVFSGYRIRRLFTWDKSNPECHMPQIQVVLSETLSKLKDYLAKNKESVDKDTCHWQGWESLELGVDGEDKPDFTVVKNGRMLIGYK